MIPPLNFLVLLFLFTKQEGFQDCALPGSSSSLSSSLLLSSTSSTFRSTTARSTDSSHSGVVTSLNPPPFPSPLSTDGYDNPIVVTSSIDLPFSSHVAYDAFSNLPRQPSWSPWLKRVCYVDDDNEDASSTTAHCSSPPRRRISQWTMQIAGLSFSWKSVSTLQERPHAIEWESTSGLRNKGRVDIVSSSAPPLLDNTHDLHPLLDGSEVKNDACCHMKLTMVFQVPRIVAALFRHDFTAIQRQMEERILKRTLSNFRDVVLRHDLQHASEQHAQILRESGMLFPH